MLELGHAGGHLWGSFPSLPAASRGSQVVGWGLQNSQWEKRGAQGHGGPAEGAQERAFGWPCSDTLPRGQRKHRFSSLMANDAVQKERRKRLPEGGWKRWWKYFSQASQGFK